MAKGRVASLKHITLPRLELLDCLIAALPLFGRHFACLTSRHASAGVTL